MSEGLVYFLKLTRHYLPLSGKNNQYRFIGLPNFQGLPNTVFLIFHFLNFIRSLKNRFERESSRGLIGQVILKKRNLFILYF